MESQPLYWLNSYWDGLDWSPLPLTDDFQTTNSDSFTDEYAVQCVYCAWTGQVCLCHSTFSTWTGDDPWLLDVGPERSELDEQKTPSDGHGPEWYLVWSKELAPSVRARRIAFYFDEELTAATESWTSEELEARRRVVNVRISPAGPSITVSMMEHDEEGIPISCIWWQEKGECFVTCADMTRLLEPLLCQGRSDSKVKSRVRRPMAFFKPFVVSDRRNRELYKLITAFGVPHPWKMKKSFSVLPWSVLEPALRRVLENYRAVDKTVGFLDA